MKKNTQLRNKKTTVRYGLQLIIWKTVCSIRSAAIAEIRHSACLKERQYIIESISEFIVSESLTKNYIC
ncbi:MAG: hypothetical protein LBB53_00045 [Prevotellaceae bacterium]|jgi:hypothetical protein|nr:hypothetical protein [Prevotellaceae bacterium]